MTRPRVHWIDLCLCLSWLVVATNAQNPPPAPTLVQRLANQLIEAASPEAVQTLLTAQANVNQTELAQTLIAEGRQRRDANPLQANTAFRLAVAVAQKAQDKENEATAYYNWGILISRQGNHKQALEYFEQSLALRRKLPDQVELAKVLNNVAGMYQNLGLYHRVLAAYEETLRLKQKALQDNPTNPDLKNTVANSLVSVGRFYRVLGNYPLALQHVAHGLQIYQELNNKPSLAYALNEQGYTQFEMGAPEKALVSFQQALTHNRAAEKADPDQRAQLLNNLGQVYLQLGKLAEALEACQESLRLRVTLRQQEKIGRTQWHLASIFLAQKTTPKPCNSRTPPPRSRASVPLKIIGKPARLPDAPAGSKSNLRPRANALTTPSTRLSICARKPTFRLTLSNATLKTRSHRIWRW